MAAVVEIPAKLAEILRGSDVKGSTIIKLARVQPEGCGPEVFLLETF